MISSLVLCNFGPFRGEHRIDLAPTVYAVVARREDDPEQSNWSGKSWLLSSIRFALYGSHLADREDDWITRGEREGGVLLALSDGTAVERSRTLGGSTQLAVSYDVDPFGGQSCARGKDAQQLLERRLGLSERDFLAASFFEQKQMARFITAGPAKRSEDVSAWLRLDRIRRAHKRAAYLADGRATEEACLAAREAALRDRLAALTTPRPGSTRVGPPCEQGRECGVAGCTLCSKAPDPLLHARCVVEILEGKAGVAARDARAKEGELQDAQRLLGLAHAVRHREQLIAEIAELATQGGEEPDLGPLRARAEEASHASRAATLDAIQKGTLARGGFAGTCPVNGGSCPIAGQLNADRQRNEALSAAAREVALEANAAKVEATAELELAQGAMDALRARRARLQALRDQLARIDASTPLLSPGTAIPDPAAVWRLEQEVRGLRDLERAAVFDLGRARRAADEVSHLLAEIEQIGEERAQVAAELRTHREAMAVLGRNGAQRRIAEGALREVEVGACGLLAEAGIDLSVSLAWDRPTDQPAGACDGCDFAYPPSRKVKACPRCGAPRGQKLAEGLEVKLSKVSGFAEDAAGIALSLSASAWLRRERDVQWPVLCADEPWAAADRHNRRALLGLFKAAGRRCQIRQMFLVAHDDALMDGLPGRIEVVAGADGSRVSVVS